MTTPTTRPHGSARLIVTTVHEFQLFYWGGVRFDQLALYLNPRGITSEELARTLPELVAAGYLAATPLGGCYVLGEVRL